MKIHPLLIKVTISTLIAIAAGACGGDGASDAIPASASPDATAVSPSTDPAMVLPTISAAMSEVRSWQVEAQLTVDDVTADGEQSLITTIHAARSGLGANIVVTRSNATTGSISGFTSAENRIVDAQRYRRDPNSGIWTVSDAGDEPASLTVDADVVGQIDTSTATVNLTELGGEGVYHVTGTVPGVDAAESVEVFAGINDNLVRMILLEGGAPGSNFGGLLAISERLLPQSVEAHYLEYGRPITVHVPPIIGETDNAETRSYLSTINPFTMAVPGDLRPAPRNELMGETFNGTGGEALFIIEEYLDVEEAFVGELAGADPDAVTYARRFQIEIEKSGTYEVLSNEPFTTDSGLQARLILFTEAEGAVKWAHLSYLHGDDFGFGASYGGYTERYDEIEDAIMASFRSFAIVE